MSAEGLAKFEKTFGYLAGEPMDWRSYNAKVKLRQFIDAI